MVIKLAIVGTGGMANWHAIRFGKVPGCVITACCDIRLERAREFAKKHGIEEVYSDYREMLREGDMDAVSVVTSDDFHAPVSIAALKAGKHVFCEKPISTNVSDTLKMLEAVKRSGKINMINFTYLSSSAVKRAAELVRDGKIGKVLHVESSYLQSWLIRSKPEKLAGNWRHVRKLGGGGVLGDIGCHILSLTSHVAGDISVIRSVYRTHEIPCLKKNRVGKVVLDANNDAVILAEFKNGGLGVIHTAQVAMGHSNSIKLAVYGDKGAVKVDLDESNSEFMAYYSNRCKDDGWGRMDWVKVDGGENSTMYEKFIGSIRTGRQVSPSFYDGYKVQKYVDACFKSGKEGGKAVKI